LDTEQTRSTTAPVSMKVPQTPKISIGMPVFNGELFIREALDSLLAQTFTDFELIISDNASTDGTEAICKEYAAKDRRIRYVRQSDNRGAVANFQFVLDEAVGEYFMWAAADDSRHPDFIKMAEWVLSAAPKVGLVFCGVKTMNFLNGDSTYSLTGFATTKRKFLRVLFRLSHVCPSLIYGLYRKETLSQIKLEQYDYFDVYLTLWFELNSSICVIPMGLYTAGTNGVRIPYSITGDFIDEKNYLKRVGDLFKEHFGVVPAFFLNRLNRYLFEKATKAHNRLIKSRVG
jgi:glycosyltransferase involved in cell wall biosynthesis